MKCPNCGKVMKKECEACGTPPFDCKCPSPKPMRYHHCYKCGILNYMPKYYNIRRDKNAI